MREFPVLILLFLMFLPKLSQAQDQNLQTLHKAQNAIDEAYLTQNPVLLDETVSLLNELTLAETDSLRKYMHYYRGLAYFRMFPLPMNEDSDLFSNNLDKAQMELEQAVKLDPDFAEAYALLGGVYGMKAAGMFSGMKYGKKAKRAMAKARELSPNNPRIYLIDGIGDYYKPKLFGGGLNNALEAFTASRDLFHDFEPDSELSPEWGRAENHLWLGICYLDDNKEKKAALAFKKAHELAPDFLILKKQYQEYLN